MFSVVIPYFKKRQYIERCLDSVLGQTYKDFEIILVDDGSEDDVSELIYHKYPNKVKLIHQENQGVSAARNRGIAESSKSYIAFLDADDYWCTNYLQKNADVMQKEDDIKILGSQYTRNKSLLESDEKAVSYSKIANYFKIGIPNTYFQTSATIVRRDFFLQNSGFNSKLKYGEDLDVWFRAILSGGEVIFINNILVYYSDEDENQATNKKAKLSDTISYHALDLYSSFFHNKDFEIFINKLVYFSIYRAAFSDYNRIEASEVLGKLTKKYVLADLYYAMPYRLGKYLIENRRGKKYARQYLKFLFTFIYKK